VSSAGGTIREETSEDDAAIRDVVADAFGRVEEAVLVERLRSDHPAEFGPALVAEVDGQVVGYVCCSQMRLDDAPGVTLLGLGPIAVLPSRQMMGIGSALVRRVQELVTAPIALLGDPGWYVRFGFVPAEPLGIRSQWEHMGDAWQIWFPPEVAPAGYRGTARYLPPFDEV
jgi:putative acetyltransferase